MGVAPHFLTHRLTFLRKAQCALGRCSDGPPIAPKWNYTGLYMCEMSMWHWSKNFECWQLRQSFHSDHRSHSHLILNSWGLADWPSCRRDSMHFASLVAKQLRQSDTTRLPPPPQLIQRSTLPNAFQSLRHPPHRDRVVIGLQLLNSNDNWR